jgi:hypothetical protein
MIPPVVDEKLKLWTVTGVPDSLFERKLGTEDDRLLYSLTALADEDREALREPRLHTNRGRPLGRDDIVAKLEVAMNRRLRPASRRPAAKDGRKRATVPSFGSSTVPSFGSASCGIRS